jgi:threonyl-tRNA synthetase
VLGSLERFLSILVEQNEGNWPFWLSPRQAIILPISEKFNEYGEKVYKALKYNGFHVELDSSDCRVNKKIRLAQLDRWNYMLVVGQKEASEGIVNLRSRDEGNIGEIGVEELIKKFEKERRVLPKYEFKHDSKE